jgi:hypothetical protein
MAEKAPVKTGKEQRMKEPYGKGLGPESCAGHGNMTGEALTRVPAGQPWSCEIILVCPTWTRIPVRAIDRRPTPTIIKRFGWGAPLGSNKLT